VHTVFGQVRDGMDVVNGIRQNDVINSIRVS
jgi:cyclophilin family peptidyl-prolyl cis-trans isomerase